MSERKAAEPRDPDSLEALGQVLLGAAGMPATISSALKLLSEFFRGEGAVLWLVDDDANELVRKQIVHLEGSPSKAFELESANERLKFGETLAGQVWAKSAPVILEMPAMFAQTAHPGELSSNADQRISNLAFPIYADGAIFGVAEIIRCSITELDASTARTVQISAAYLGAFVYSCVCAERMAKYQRQVAELLDGASWHEQEMRAAKLRLAKEHDRAVKASLFHAQYLRKVSSDLRTQLGGILGIIDLLDRTGLAEQQQEYSSIMRESAQIILGIIEEISKNSIGDAQLFVPKHADDSEQKTELNKTDTSAATVVSNSVDRASADSPPTKVRVLVVNGMIGSAEFIEAYTVSAGIECHSATRGHTALTLMHQAVLAAKPFDVVFVEMVLPDMDAYEFARVVESDEEFSVSKLILVSSFDSMPRNDRALQAGFVLHLARPMKQKHVLGAINSVMSGKTLQYRNGSLQMVPAALSGKPMVLVAEDNPVNQKVALLQLKELGFYAKLVTNGKEAVEAIKQGGFAAILMDAQMPKMDGFEATRRIRQWEQAVGGHIPVIAMTAHSMPVDRRKCLAAGMDDYLSKPVTYDKLGSVLSKWIELEHVAQAHAGENTMKEQIGGDNLQFSPDSALDTPAPIDIDSLAEMVGEQEAVEILNIFVSSSEELLEKISGAFNRHDGIALREAAHELKGACSSIGAMSMARNCQELETAARNDDWATVPALEGGLSENFQIAKNYIQTKIS